MERARFQSGLKHCRLPLKPGRYVKLHILSAINTGGRRKNRESFINRMGFSSVLLQAVCDVNMKFIHIYVGRPGSIHVARMFRNSDLTELFEDVPLDLHILGDSAYLLNVALLTPYRDNDLHQSKDKFNTLHSTSRSVVEGTFGLFKGQFRRLKYLDVSLDFKIPEVISTCLALHNYIRSTEKKVQCRNVVKFLRKILKACMLEILQMLLRREMELQLPYRELNETSMVKQEFDGIKQEFDGSTSRVTVYFSLTPFIVNFPVLDSLFGLKDMHKNLEYFGLDI
ncbi:LOW QUALITY PROTEIN: hypothetical protein KUTeg_018788 [Tegillarca granosa]|uniref:DDE Tnp4 domain-containing protein n=1 Tax=Tegillarca granosa TaxID=220873 RepID=A0ABQ9EEE8_TEGGR|nr:LOW QUALITY PROTEIN: hypothetical protein KUTeg_018788 [Tegillarca granosa]